MQNKKSIIGLVTMLLLITASIGILSSCEKTFDEPFGEPTPELTANIKIRDLKEMHIKGEVETLDTNLVIEGIINASDKSGNYYKQISIQDSTGGITIRMDGSGLYTTYPVGRQVFIKLKGLFMGDYNGLIQLGGSIDNTGPHLNVRPIAYNLFDTYIVKGSLDNVVTPKVVTIADLNDSYQSMLIQINDAEFATGDVNKTYGDAVNQLSANVNVTPCAGGSIIVRTSGYCSFAGVNVPDGNGKLLSIYTIFGTVKQLVVRDTSDVQFYNPTRCTAGGGGGDGPFISIEALRNLYVNEDVDIVSNRIKGIVISGGPGKNISAGNIVLQDGNRGITLYFGSPAASALAAFQIGDSLVVDISGGTLTSYNNLLEVTLSSTSVPASPAGLASAGSGLSVVVKDMTIADLVANIATVENTMVRIVNATVTPPGTYSGNKTLTDASGTMFMRTVPTASFAGATLPTTCQNWVGYPGRFKEDKQLYIRNPATDVTAGTTCGIIPPPPGGLLVEDFEGVTTTGTTPVAMPGWKNIGPTAGTSYLGKIFSSNKYAQISAFSSTLPAVKSWLITPGVNLDATTGEILTFKTKDGFNNGSTLKVYYSTNYDGGADPSTSTWTQLSAIIASGTTTGYAPNFTNSGDVSLGAVVGTVYIAFVYEGGDPGKTTTYQLDDVKIVGN